MTSKTYYVLFLRHSEVKKVPFETLDNTQTPSLTGLMVLALDSSDLVTARKTSRSFSSL